MKPSLLDQAKQVSVGRKGRRPNQITEDELDLAIAYFEGKISRPQVAKVTGYNPNSIGTMMNQWIGKAFRTGLVIRAPRRK